jgi:hypothetical protein
MWKQRAQRTVAIGVPQRGQLRTSSRTLIAQAGHS